MKYHDFKLERYFAQYEFSAKYLLSSSDCESVSVGDLLELSQGKIEDLKNVWLGYTESKGHPQLREAIANSYSGMRVENILVHSGAQEAIFSFVHCCLEVDDHIIVLQPAYQSLFSLAEDRGIEVSPWMMEECTGGWKLDLNKLISLIKPKTKALVVNFPHNPTGFTLSLKMFEEIIAICRKHNLTFFSDEVYRGLEFQSETLPAACEKYEKAVSLGVLSKAQGLAGLRTGWVATRDLDILNKMASFKDFTTICNSAPSEYLSILAMQVQDKLIDRNKKIILDNLKVAEVYFNQKSEAFEWKPPMAGPIGFIKLKKESADDYCSRMIKEKSIMILPSTVYDAGNRHIRIGFGRKSFSQVLALL